MSRRLLIAGFYFASLAIVALVTAFLTRNFTGLGPVPERSAFAGRLPSTPDGDRRRFQMFYATNRDTSDPATFAERGSKLGNTISTGVFDVRIAPSMPIKPFVWFDSEQMEWAGQKELPEQEFLEQLRTAVAASPNKSVLVIVWGFRDWFRSAALKTAYTAFALDINTPIIMFDWPGNQGEGPNGYMASRQASEASAPALGQFLTKVQRESGAERVWLMGSSLGCQTIADSFKWLQSQPELIAGLPKIDHVVLAAPDVSAQAFDDKFADSIKALSRYLTVYVSSNDKALLMSHWLNRDRRLGRLAEISVPPEERASQYQLEEGLELLDLQAEEGLSNLSMVDATPINLTRNLHHFFTDSPEFFDDLYRHLLQPDSMVSRRLHALRAGEGRNYWILWND
ncbi:alpha/beta hydrolase [Planctomicrobium piriforme]|uniref:alpha/beta hydrolase n=1 Tax=Planctomicrobium piriforme TaxID=1576369 RepID=UPI0015872E77|nr:alpha/beta hydrolase [Planctomicrobium piriforme]